MASLSATKQAKDDFRPLGQAWLTGNRAERQELEPSLLTFRERHPKDDLSQVAAVYLAWNAMERGELGRARELVATALTGPSGVTHDFGDIAFAAILRREGDAEAALSRLQPLVGKVIDPHTRALFGEELVQAAIGASRYYEAVGYMDVWLQQADEGERRGTTRKIARALEGLPVEVAQSIVRAPFESGYSAELRRLLVRRLERQGDASPEFSRDPAHVEGRTVGLLLSLGSTSQRARAAEALTGVLDGLALPRDERGAPLLVTSDDGGDDSKTEAALAELAARGTAIAIAGLDPKQAAAAIRFADRTSMPIVLLAAPEGENARPSSVFVAAGGEEGIETKLMQALFARGATKLGWVFDSADLTKTAGIDAHLVASCDAGVSGGEARFPVAAWQKDKIGGLLLLGSPGCAEDALSALGGKKAMAAVGLDAAARLAWDPKKAKGLVLPSAGLFPLREDDKESPLSTWVERHGSPPSYFGALARDAAVLAGAALAELPTTRATEPGDVAWRYVETTRALERAERDLWTTTARGFGSDHELSRELRIVEIE